LVPAYAGTNEERNRTQHPPLIPVPAFIIGPDFPDPLARTGSGGSPGTNSNSVTYNSGSPLARGRTGKREAASQFRSFPRKRESRTTTAAKLSQGRADYM